MKIKKKYHNPLVFNNLYFFLKVSRKVDYLLDVNNYRKVAFD